jgi:hypothetical protein
MYDYVYRLGGTEQYAGIFGESTRILDGLIMC